MTASNAKASFEIVELTDDNFDAEVIGSDLPVLVDAHATWCGPCRALAPVIEEIARDFAGQVKVAKLDIDNGAATATRYRIVSVPTVFLFRGGEVVDTVVGAQPKEFYLKLLQGAAA